MLWLHPVCSLMSPSLFFSVTPSILQLRCRFTTTFILQSHPKPRVLSHFHLRASPCCLFWQIWGGGCPQGDAAAYRLHNLLPGCFHCGLSWMHAETKSFVMVLPKIQRCHTSQADTNADTLSHPETREMKMQHKLLSAEWLFGSLQKVKQMFRLKRAGQKLKGAKEN